MLEKLKNCPLCGSDIAETSIICKDYTVSQENFVIITCENCKLKYTNPRPTEENISKYYQSEKYISHNDKSNNLIAKVYSIIRSKALKDKINLINRYKKKGTLLDIGCGTGSFIELCKTEGWKVEGIEPNEKARELATIKIKEKILENVFLLENTEYYDVITMWHVLEHVHKIEETIIEIRNLLKKNGLFVIAVPNNNSYDAKIFKEYWAAYDVPRHLYHFTKETLVELIEKFDFKLREISPMKFDAYYISLLSQKYKNNKSNFALAMWQGFKSNQWADKNGNNYSSLTYIFEK